MRSFGFAQDDKGWGVRVTGLGRVIVILAKAGIHLWVDGPQPSLGRRCFAGATLFRWGVRMTGLGRVLVILAKAGI